MKGTMFDLSGRTALVTGGSRGLGRAMARGFALAGADVFLCSRDGDELKEAARELADETGRRIECAVADLMRREEVEPLAQKALDALGKIDILVNNAGGNIVSPVDQIVDRDWDDLMQLNVHSGMALTRALAPGMKERRWGRVIFTSSIMAFLSTAGRNAYSTTKSALHGLVKSCSLDLGPYGITVNCIAPGPFATHMPMSILSKKQQEELAARTALGRWGLPDELAGPALLLASDAGSYITGSILIVDGGVMARVF
ncbi:MAG: SDR family oxidoreductase [Pirellulales bacterium]|nr:SDR family oxidoreductase [Pirellulales bacterium]